MTTTRDTNNTVQFAHAIYADMTHNEYIRPAVEGDGVTIHFKSFINGKVTLVLKGACNGCPSTKTTLKQGVENLLRRMLPEVQEVIAETA